MSTTKVRVNEVLETVLGNCEFAEEMEMSNLSEDSLERAEILLLLEDEFDIDFGSFDDFEFDTLGQLYSVVESHTVLE